MKHFHFLALSAMLLAACTNDSDDGNQPVALNIYSSIDASPAAQTRAANDTWQSGDDIGLYAVKTGTTTAISANAQFTTSGNTSTTTFTTATPVYLPTDGSAIDVYAYYPYTADANPAAQPINVSNQTSQEAIDWMTTGLTDKTTQGGSTAITKVNPSVALLFAHRLVKLQFNLVHGTGMTAADIIGNAPALAIAGLDTKATLNLYTGAVASPNTPSNITPVMMGTAATGHDASFEAIILPCTTTATHVVTLTLGKATYTFNIESNKTFAAGNKYTYNVTVNASYLTVTASITNWGNGGETAVSAQ